MREQLKEYLIWTAILVGITALQIIFGNLISINGVEPDFLLIAVVFLALRFGQVPAMSYGFAFGLLLDLYQGELIGISSLALTVAAFSIGYAHDPERADMRVRSYGVIPLVGAGAIIRNTVSIFAYFQSLNFDILSVLGRQVLLGAVYTTVISMIPVLVLVRTGNRLKV